MILLLNLGLLLYYSPRLTIVALAVVALIAVVVLAIGIGLCGFMFSIIYGIYFRGLDIAEADRVFVVYETNVERLFEKKPTTRRERRKEAEAKAEKAGKAYRYPTIDELRAEDEEKEPEGDEPPRRSKYRTDHYLSLRSPV